MKISRKTEKRISAFFESLIMLWVVFFMFYMLAPNPREFLELNPHPFMIVIAVISLFYGNLMGILCASFASVLYVYAYQHVGKDLFFLITDFSQYKYILTFFMTAILLGITRDYWSHSFKELETTLEEQQTDYENLKEIHEKTEFIKNELKQQVIGTEDSILTLYDMATSLESTNSELLYTEMMGVFSKFLKVKTMSIYTLGAKSSYLRLKIRMGGGSHLPNSINIREHVFFNEVVQQKKVKKNLKDLELYPVFSAPIINNNEVIGIINIEDMDFMVITDYTFNLFRIIVDWSNKALTRALSIESATSAKDYYRGTLVMKLPKFKERLVIEQQRRDKYGQNFILLEFDVGDMDIADINTRLKGVIRDADIASVDRKQKRLYVLLPVCPEEFCPVIKERILSSFDYNIQELTHEESV